MSGALVRGGIGTEIALRDILPPHLRSGLATRARTEPIAREYEARHPGAVVVCDWELFDDTDISAMGEDDRQQALNDRAALAQRRDEASKLEPAQEPQRGGDPERNRELLRRAKNEIAMLDPKSDGYKSRFEDLQRQINLLQDACGETRTTYPQGRPIENVATKLSPSRKEELQNKVTNYRSQATSTRKVTITKVTDPILAQMLFDVEVEKPLRDALALRLVELGAVAAT